MFSSSFDCGSQQKLGSASAEAVFAAPQLQGSCTRSFTIKQPVQQCSQHSNIFCTVCTNVNWRPLCDGLQGTLSSRKMWHLLRHVIKSKGETSGSLALARGNHR